MRTLFSCTSLAMLLTFTACTQTRIVTESNMKDSFDVIEEKSQNLTAEITKTDNQLVMAKDIRVEKDSLFYSTVYETENAIVLRDVSSIRFIDEEKGKIIGSAIGTLSGAVLGGYIMAKTADTDDNIIILNPTPHRISIGVALGGILVGIPGGLTGEANGYITIYHFNQLNYPFQKQDNEEVSDSTIAPNNTSDHN